MEALTDQEIKAIEKKALATPVPQPLRGWLRGEKR
jgi:hypothetical protein